MENNQSNSSRIFNPNFIPRDILQAYLFWHGTRGHVWLRMAVSDDTNSFHSNTSLTEKGTEQASNIDYHILYDDNLDLPTSDIVERFRVLMEW